MHSVDFKKEISARHSSKDEASMAQIENEYLVREFLKSYQSFKVSKKQHNLFEQRQTKQLQPKSGDPVSIVRSDYMTNIR